MKWVVDVLSSPPFGLDEEGFGILLEDCIHHVASSYIHIDLAPTPICGKMCASNLLYSNSLHSRPPSSSRASLVEEISRLFKRGQPGRSNG